MDDLTRDSWDVMSRLAQAARDLARAHEKAKAATEEAERLDKMMRSDLEIIHRRLGTSGVESVFYGTISEPFIVANQDNVGFLLPVSPFDLDREYELATGIKPGKPPEADPTDMVDLTQPAHEAATAPSNN